MSPYHLVAAALFVSLLASCTGSTSSDGSTSDARADTVASTGSVTAAPSTTAPPGILAIGPDLGLKPDECWSKIPEPTTTTTTISRSLEGDEGQDSEVAVPQTLPVQATTTPRPPSVAVVVCDGSKDGQAFAAFCLADDSESESNRLTAGGCENVVDLEWPGDRAVRRAAARICLQRFEDRFKQPYSESELLVREFTPSEGVWAQGDQRVVCSSSEPAQQ